jgi:hypothetical protein
MIGHVVRAALPIILFAGLACDGEGSATPTQMTSQSASAVVGACETGFSDKFVIVPYGERLEAVIEPIADALTKAIDTAAAAYGWTPTDPICVRVFPGDAEFVGGLRKWGGFNEATARSYQTYFGTIGKDVSSGRDAIYLNAAFPRRMPFLVTHEYFHIVQMHVGGAGGGPQATCPTWFLEGVADWEALKLQDPPFPNWLAVLRSEQQAGRAPSLTSLVSWEQWREAVATGNPAVPTAGYNKARAAAIFLEKIAGPAAARDIIRRNAGGNVVQFDTIFREVTGLDVSEFERRLVAWLIEVPSGQ